MVSRSASNSAIDVLISPFRRFARPFVPDEIKGWIDFYRFPERRLGWDGPFNSQIGRRAIFETIMAIVAPSLILETGTYLGMTTELMAETGIPIVTVESKARYYGFSRARLRRFKNVELRLGDSRAEARRVLFERRNTLRQQPLFAYLDSHWNKDLPLAEELEIVFSNVPNAVVMIDDFSVPDDPGYGYDDYGENKALEQTYISPTLNAYGLTALYPTLASEMETGRRRGCVVLANELFWRQLIRTNLLRRL
jgi:predicted O-methyltransferase YrrM